jgi:hypothetical protein
LGVRESHFASNVKCGNEVHLPLAQKTNKTVPRVPLCLLSDHIPQRSAAVCTGASHSASMSASTAVTVIEQPAISSEVT